MYILALLAWGQRQLRVLLFYNLSFWNCDNLMKNDCENVNWPKNKLQITYFWYVILIWHLTHNFPCHAQWNSILNAVLNALCMNNKRHLHSAGIWNIFKSNTNTQFTALIAWRENNVYTSYFIVVTNVTSKPATVALSAPLSFNSWFSYNIKEGLNNMLRIP